MAYTNITPGFTGWLSVAGESAKLRFATCGINAVQEVEAPDMVMGDYTHNAWAYGKIEVGGSVSGPLDENGMSVIDALWGGTPKTITVRYYNGFDREFQYCLANSLTLNVNAGDIVNFTLDVIGTGFNTTVTPTVPYTSTTKLLTWDKAAMFIGTQSSSTFTGGSMLNDLQSFSITITNNITRQFAIRASDLYGKLVRGMSAVTGSMVSYTLKSSANFSTGQTGRGALHWDAYANNAYYPIWFNLGGKEIRATVVFHRGTSELSTGPVLTTLGFTGIGHWGGQNPFSPAHEVIN